MTISIKRFRWEKITALVLIAALISVSFGYSGGFGLNVEKAKADETYAIYSDNKHQNTVANGSIVLYANGGKISTIDGDVNTRQVKLYTNVKASYLHRSGKASCGTVVAVISKSSTKPAVNNGKVFDFSATNIATASITNGVITVKAEKEPGTVYLHVIDTGDEGAYATCSIVVKVAPTNISFFDGDAEIKNTTINLGQSKVLKVSAKYKNGNGVWKETTDPALIKVTVDPKLANVLSVEQQANGNYKITATGLNNGKKTNGNITFTSVYNNKMAQLKVVIENPAKSIAFSGVIPGSYTFAEKTSGAFVLTVDDSMLSEKQTLSKSVTVQIKTTVVPFGEGDTVISDKGKVFAMASATGYDKPQFIKGKVKLSEKLTADQKKIKVSCSNDNNTLTVKFGKGIPVGATSYFMYFFNTTAGGYKIFSISIQKAAAVAST